MVISESREKKTMKPNLVVIYTVAGALDQVLTFHYLFSCNSHLMYYFF